MFHVLQHVSDSLKRDHDPTKYGCDISVLTAKVGAIVVPDFKDGAKPVQNAYVWQNFLLQIRSAEAASHLHDLLKTSNKVKFVKDKASALSLTKPTPAQLQLLRNNVIASETLWKSTIVPAEEINDEEDFDDQQNALGQLLANQELLNEQLKNLNDYDFYNRLLKTFLQVQQVFLARFEQILPEAIKKNFKEMLHAPGATAKIQPIAADVPTDAAILDAMSPDDAPPHTLPWNNFIRYHSILFELENKYAMTNEIELHQLRASLVRPDLYGFQDKWTWQEWLDRVLLADNSILPTDMQLSKQELVSAVIVHCETSERFSHLCLTINSEIKTITNATDLDTTFWQRFRNADDSYWRKHGTRGTAIKVNAAGFYQPPNQTQKSRNAEAR